MPRYTYRLGEAETVRETRISADNSGPKECAAQATPSAPHPGSIPCQDSSDIPLLLDLTICFKEYLSILLDSTLNSKLPQHFALSYQDWKHRSFWGKKKMQQVKAPIVGAFATMETIKNKNTKQTKNPTKTIHACSQSFSCHLPDCSGYKHGHPTLDLHLPMLHTLYLDTSIWSWICSINNTRNWYCTYKANRHIESFPGHTQLKMHKKLVPGLHFIQTQQIFVLL